MTNARIEDGSASRRLQQEASAGEAGAEGGHQHGLGQAAIDQLFEHEQDRRRAHVAVLAQNVALDVQHAGRQAERGFDGVDHLHPARMAAQAGDGVARLAHRAEDLVDRCRRAWLR